jgi:hypothetical protein
MAAVARTTKDINQAYRTVRQVEENKLKKNRSLKKLRMYIVRKIFLSIAIFMQFGSVHAQQIELICRGQGSAVDMVPLKINFQKNSAAWGGVCQQSCPLF